ncbi:MAG TPA: ATP-binding protein [Gemmatimonadaceae bacterium]
MTKFLREHSRLWLYAGTIGATLVALAISLGIQSLSGRPSSVVFVVAVAIAARYGGIGPAFVSSALSLMLIDYYFLPPIGVIDFRQPEQGVNTVVFAGVMFIISSMTTRLRRAERDARERAATLAQMNAVLQEQMEEARALDESLHEANDFLTDARDAAARLANGALRLQAGTDSLSKAATSADVGTVALDAIGKLMPVSRGAVYLLRSDCLNILAVCGDDSDALESISLNGRSSDDISAPIRATLSGEAVWSTNDNGSSWPYHVSIPLVSGDEKIGVLALDARTAPPSADAERSLIRLFAHSVASALVRAKQYDAERGGREAAETLARAREDVLAVVAHDLRNPLALVSTSTEMLVEVGDDPARRRDMLEIVRRSVKRMNAMIGDLLDITRLQAGHLALESTSLQVNDLFKQVATGWTALLAKREIALHVVFPRADLRVHADLGRISQVLDNLIGNAGKFTESGGRVVVRADSDAHGQVRFSVSDNGQGIAPEAQMRLFDRFWQARRADRRGIGMGLTICKGIVEAHGGRIWVESTPGIGTKFSFTIPSPTPATQQISA